MITETNGTGSDSATSAGTSAVTPADSTPTITSASITGTAVVGDTLSAVANGVTGYPTPSPTYQWYDGSTAITGATASTYTVQSSDLGHSINVVITETNGTGSDSATSAGTSEVTPADSTPTITSASITGTAVVGDTLSAVANGVTGYPTPSPTYQWYDGSTAITGATASTYTVQSSDLGYSINVVITETNGTGSDSATSAGTSEVTPADSTPTITSSLDHRHRCGWRHPQRRCQRRDRLSNALADVPVV